MPAEDSLNSTACNVIGDPEAAWAENRSCRLFAFDGLIELSQTVARGGSCPPHTELHSR